MSNPCTISDDFGNVFIAILNTNCKDSRFEIIYFTCLLLRGDFSTLKTSLWSKVLFVPDNFLADSSLSLLNIDIELGIIVWVVDLCLWSTVINSWIVGNISNFIKGLDKILTTFKYLFVSSLSNCFICSISDAAINFSLKSLNIIGLNASCNLFVSVSFSKILPISFEIIGVASCNISKLLIFFKKSLLYRIIRFYICCYDFV